MAATVQFEAPDHFLMDELYTDEHKIIRDSVRDWVNRSVKPVIEEYFEKAEFPSFMVKEMGEMGMFGPFIPEEYGGIGLSNAGYSRVLQQTSSYDSSTSLTIGAHSSIGMKGLLLFGTDAQKEQYLPRLASGETRNWWFWPKAFAQVWMALRKYFVA